MAPPRGRPRPEVRLPPLPLRPGRQAMSKRTRAWLLVVLVAAVVVLVVVGIVLAHTTKTSLRVVTIPAADRKASPALLRAAAAVNFHPLGQGSGDGRLEDLPAAAAKPPLTSGLLPVGTLAPSFTLRTPAGRVVRLADLRGRAVLLEFFTAWCPHCAAEAPHLQRLFESLPPKRIAFVAVNADGEDAPTVLAYHIYFGLDFPAVLDPADRTVSFPDHGSPGPVTRAYRVGAYPTFYVLDRQGRVTWRSDGEQPDAQLRQQLLAAFQ